MAEHTSIGARMPAPTYIPDDDLLIAARVAMELGQPLLLTGEPGTGKTTFAQYLADVLAPSFFAVGEAAGAPAFALHTFETKSTSVASDLFYRFDSLRRFQAAHNPSMSSDNADYITFEALGRAIIESLPYDAVKDLEPDASLHQGARRSVVLIDEVDKAPRDFPNDLLNEIQRMFFRIPEITAPGSRAIRRVDAAPDMHPIVVLTSNSEKNLPAPFLRRCVFHHIRFPERQSARLGEIIRANLKHPGSVLADSALAFFYDVREHGRMDKLPTSHELMRWIQTLHTPGRFFAGDVDVSRKQLGELPLAKLKATLGVIAKTANDVSEVEALLDERYSPRTAHN